jgi:3-oxoacyl-(acyl-carrier-protein) synthase
MTINDNGREYPVASGALVDINDDSGITTLPITDALVQPQVPSQGPITHAADVHTEEKTDVVGGQTHDVLAQSSTGNVVDQMTEEIVAQSNRDIVGQTNEDVDEQTNGTNGHTAGLAEAPLTDRYSEIQTSLEPTLDAPVSIVNILPQVDQVVTVDRLEDVSRHTPQEAPINGLQDDVQDVPVDAHLDIPHQASQDVSANGQQDNTSDVPFNGPQDVPQDVPQDDLVSGHHDTQTVDCPQASIQDTPAALLEAAHTPITDHEVPPSSLPLSLPLPDTPVPQYHQEPIAVVGLACRLPDTCHNPNDLWKFLMDGGIAKSTPPASRFSLDGHYDASGRNKTMASPGGMFLQDIDPSDVDAQFFKLTPSEAIALDPQQRQLLEVVYEGLENAGIPLERLDSQRVGCFVGSFACDFGDMQARDPEDRAPASAVGVGRAMLSNRISHFLNIRGPSMTIDTACSGSMVGLDVACRYLTTGEIDGAVVAGCNIYLAPEHVMDGANGTASLTGVCHTFDEATDGYMKSEAVNMVFVKRLRDALRDGDPIRAVIRGTATNSDGWTAGIGSPDSAAQSRAIRAAYANAGITDVLATSYVECHGTGTRVGDVLEMNGLAAVFSEGRPTDKPLRVGSVSWTMIMRDVGID